jgi:hypothetical protein
MTVYWGCCSDRMAAARGAPRLPRRPVLVLDLVRVVAELAELHHDPSQQPGPLQLPRRPPHRRGGHRVRREPHQQRHRLQRVQLEQHGVDGGPAEQGRHLQHRVELGGVEQLGDHRAEARPGPAGARGQLESRRRAAAQGQDADGRGRAAEEGHAAGAAQGLRAGAGLAVEGAGALVRRPAAAPETGDPAPREPRGRAGAVPAEPEHLDAPVAGGGAVGVVEQRRGGVSGRVAARGALTVALAGTAPPL